MGPRKRLGGRAILPAAGFQPASGRVGRRLWPRLAAFALFVTLAQAQPSLDARRQALSSLLAEQWEYSLRTNPISATIYGDKRWNDQLGDFSEEFILQDLQQSRKFLTRFEAIDTTGFPDQEALNKELMVRDLRIQLEGARFKSWEMPVSQMDGIHILLPDRNLPPLHTNLGPSPSLQWVSPAKLSLGLFTAIPKLPCPRWFAQGRTSLRPGPMVSTEIHRCRGADTPESLEAQKFLFSLAGIGNLTPTPKRTGNGVALGSSPCSRSLGIQMSSMGPSIGFNFSQCPYVADSRQDISL